jgi:hypothetical protein
MLPISEDTLSFSRIAKYWSWEIKPPESEILEWLIRAWWRGELLVDSPSRLDVLKGMFTVGNNGLSRYIAFDGETKKDRQIRKTCQMEACGSICG